MKDSDQNALFARSGLPEAEMTSEIDGCPRAAQTTFLNYILRVGCFPMLLNCDSSGQLRPYPPTLGNTLQRLGPLCLHNPHPLQRPARAALLGGHYACTRTSQVTDARVDPPCPVPPPQTAREAPPGDADLSAPRPPPPDPMVGG